MYLSAIQVRAFDFLPKPELLGEMALRITVSLAFAALLQWVAVLAISRFEKLLVRVGIPGDHDEQRAKTLGQLLSSFTAVLIGGGTMIHVLGIVGWDVKTLLAGAGVLGLAVSFGAQTLVKDTIAGVFILAEDQFAVGDLIEVSGKPATVEAISLRYTRLRDFNGYLHFVPNGEMRIVTNRSRGWQRLAVDVPVASDQNLEGPMRVVRNVAEAMNDDPLWRERLLDPIEVWGVESLGPSEATLRLVLRAAPGPNAPEAARELRARVHNALMRAGHKVSAGRDIQITQIPASDAQRTGSPA